MLISKLSAAKGLGVQEQGPGPTILPKPPASQDSVKLHAY